MAIRVFLGLSALLWLSYGLFCFFRPGFLEGAAGIAAASPTGTTEIRAMYGGLEAAIGAMAVAALVRPDLARGVVFAMAFLVGGLFVSRLVGAFADGSFSQYTVGALALEAIITFVSIALLRTSPGSDS